MGALHKLFTDLFHGESSHGSKNFHDGLKCSVVFKCKVVSFFSAVPQL